MVNFDYIIIEVECATIQEKGIEKQGLAWL